MLSLGAGAGVLGHVVQKKLGRLIGGLVQRLWYRQGHFGTDARAPDDGWSGPEIKVLGLSQVHWCQVQIHALGPGRQGAPLGGLVHPADDVIHMV